MNELNFNHDGITFPDFNEITSQSDNDEPFFEPDSAHPQATQWKEPLEIMSNRYEMKSYPLEALPAELKQAVQDVHSITKAPIAMCATALLSALSLAAQGHANVKRGKYLVGPISLFALVIGESGERKSTVDSLVFKAIKTHQKEMEKLLAPEIKKYKAEMQVWEAKKKGINSEITKGIKTNIGATRRTVDLDALKAMLIEIETKSPVPPMVPLLISDNPTPEALLRDLAQVWPSSSTISAEAGIVFGSHGMGSDSVMRNLATLNILWDGEERKNRRADDSKNFVVRGARYTMSLQIQHHVLVDFMERAGALARGSGFLARFLIAWPESTQGTRFYEEPTSIKNGLAKFDARISQLLQKKLPRVDESSFELLPPALNFTAEAKKVWVELHDTIERELRKHGEYEDVRDVASKTADNAARIAALFHVYKHGPEGDISQQHIAAAGAVAYWHLGESQRLLDNLAQESSTHLLALLDSWLIDRCKRHDVNKVSTREISQYGPNKLRKAAELQKALQELSGLNRVREIEDGRKKLVVLNPALLKS